MKALAVVIPAVAGLLGTVAPSSPTAADSIPYPADYRFWTHVKSEGTGPASPGFATSGGIHHIYANKQGLEGYLTGKFPDGAVLVSDFMETRDSAGVIMEGARRRIDVMVKDSKRFSVTGGWGYERFKGDSRTERMATPEVAARCYSCHSQQESNDYVWSKLRK